MKFGLALLTALVAVAALAVATRQDARQSGVVESVTPTRTPGADAAPSRRASGSSTARERLGPATSDPFNAMQAQVVSKPKVAPPPLAVPPPAPPAAPVAPPFPYRVFGKMTGPTDQHVTYLMRDNRLIAVEPGMELDGGYKVESMSEASIEIVYVPMGQKTTLRIPEAAR